MTNFPLFHAWHKREPSREELQLALRVHEIIHRLIQESFISYERAFTLATVGLPHRQWQIARYLGFDARPKATQMPSATGRQKIFHDRSATRMACKVLEEAMNASGPGKSLTLKDLGL